MKSLTANARITLGLTALVLSVILSAQFLGMIPNDYNLRMEARSQLCESFAINLSLMARRNDVASMEGALTAIVKRNPMIRSIGVRRPDGTLQFQIGDHAVCWRGARDDLSTETHMYVPITQSGKPWGKVEVAFEPIHGQGLSWWYEQPLLRISLFVVCATFFGIYMYLRRVLAVLNPSKVVPNRVRSALDTLAEGLLVLDNSGRIVLANRSFMTTIGKTQEELLGRPIDQMDWNRRADGEAVDENGQPISTAHVPGAPWREALSEGVSSRGQLYDIAGQDGRPRTFAVSAAPICDDAGKRRGAITSFEDVTRLEQKKTELVRTLASLRKSAETIREQNRHLETLATRDPLTGCFNRRSLFDQFEQHWSQSARYNRPLSCIMVDIDHFKSINDTHGHQTGDDVLKRVGELLMETARENDVVARYGGEEFSIVCPETDLLNAAVLAERIRKAIAGLEFANLRVTASLGVSALSEQAPNAQGLIEQADQCLYVAKRSGRNQVVRFDQRPADMPAPEKNTRESSGPSGTTVTAGAMAAAIPYPAVTALISAMNYRDPNTAAHSRRVADLCASVGHGITSLESNYVLEMAALLHDIGKIGVPDAILRKPGALSREEWDVMRRHERVGLEIVHSSFNSPELSAILDNYRSSFNFGKEGGVVPSGSRIPLGARILAVADAYDSMITDQVYRAGRSQAEAFAELRRCAGAQFDPEIVERFIEAVLIQSRVAQRPNLAVSKETALTIGTLLERLAIAVDHQDLTALSRLAGQLAETAKKHQAPEIASKAMELETAVREKADTFKILNSANELFNYCRATQKSYLQDATAL